MGLFAGAGSTVFNLSIPNSFPEAVDHRYRSTVVQPNILFFKVPAKGLFLFAGMW